ncbi:hypothetical protein MMC19_005869 [Ptychographa xylographoides]|nr:hypothetical protein [Ptychographa xylographoides]
MSTTKTILITGATGKQGGAVIEALLAAKYSEPIHLVAVTRSSSSAGARALASKSNVTILEGDLDNSNAIFRQLGPVWGVFSVQIDSPGTNNEEKQGMALIDAAIAYNVQHFVYTSGDRGGPYRSPVDPTSIKSFIAKFNIEKHLETRAAQSQQGMTYTILRPVTFFENQTNDIHGKGFARLWEQIGDRPLQLISTKDIGWFAAQALMYPDENRNKALSLAGDELTQAQAAKVFKEVVGKEMPIAPCPIGSALKYFKGETLGAMFLWFKEFGYGADLEACRKACPEIQDYKTWLRHSSAFVKR